MTHNDYRAIRPRWMLPFQWLPSFFFSRGLFDHIRHFWRSVWNDCLIRDALKWSRNVLDQKPQIRAYILVISHNLPWHQRVWFTLYWLKAAILGCVTSFCAIMKWCKAEKILSWVQNITAKDAINHSAKVFFFLNKTQAECMKLAFKEWHVFIQSFVLFSLQEPSPPLQTLATVWNVKLSSTFDPIQTNSIDHFITERIWGLKLQYTSHLHPLGLVTAFRLWKWSVRELTWPAGPIYSAQLIWNPFPST